MGFGSTHPGFRGVYVDIADFSDIYRLNYGSRIASRVLFPLEHFKVWDDRGLYRGARKIDWSQYLKLKETFAIDFSVDHPAFKNSLYAAQVVKDAICDHFRDKEGSRPSVDTLRPQVQFHLYIREGYATLSLDTSGVPLHKRGYRQEGGEAPLQETLAAALLRLARYTKDDTLLDPCMGSGTFLIEAAMMASNTPPGYLRQKWGFTSHPEYSESAWLKTKQALDKAILPLSPNKIFGIDINKAQLRLALANIRTAGFHRFIKVAEGDFRDFTPEIKPSLIIANPPYGKRMGGDEPYMTSLYQALGDFFKAQAPAKAFVLTSANYPIGLRTSKRHLISTGGLEARFFEFDIF